MVIRGILRRGSHHHVVGRLLLSHPVRRRGALFALAAGVGVAGAKLVATLTVAIA